MSKLLPHLALPLTPVPSQLPGQNEVAAVMGLTDPREMLLGRASVRERTLLPPPLGSQATQFPLSVPQFSPPEPWFAHSNHIMTPTASQAAV